MSDRTRTDDELSGHPDRAANLQAGFTRFFRVREKYEIAPGGVLIGGGGHARWYAPIAHTELPQMVAKLAHADDRGLLAFASRYGNLGFTSLTSDPKKASYVWPDGQTTMGGDPIEWIRAHAETVQLCLELTEALQRNSAKDIDALTLRDRLIDDRPTYEFLRVAELDEINDEFQVHLNPPAFDVARTVRATLINANIWRIHRALTVDEAGKDRSFFVCGTPIEAVYWHLANLADGGVVMRCKRPGCGALCIQRHKSQEYCAPLGHQRESPCALWVRQSRLSLKRVPGSQQIATEVKTRGKTAPQLPARKNKRARQSSRRKGRA